jgi:hypothetical protein
MTNKLDVDVTVNDTNVQLWIGISHSVLYLRRRKLWSDLAELTSALDLKLHFFVNTFVTGSGLFWQGHKI